MHDIREWLAGLGLDRFADVFEREELTLDNVCELTEDDLKDLGLPLGPRKTIMKAMGSLRGGALPVPAAPDSYTPAHLAQKILTSRAALEGERKQVTVLFCDIAESTMLATRAGAEAMHQVLSRFFELALAEVHRYEGTVNQFLGDGFMALFGAPVAHEDDARRGVLAALGIRRALSEQRERLRPVEGMELQVRMGLHTGPVVVGSIGDNLRMDYTAIGDTTNLAARLEQHAKPGEILLSEVTARLVNGYVSLEAIPAPVLKGIAGSVSAYRATALGQRRSRLDSERALSPFVGRDREITTLREALDDVLAGRGQVVGIVGEPGVGKSRVLYEFRQRLAEQGVAYLEGWCQSFGQSIPYLPMLDLLRGTCAIQAGDAPGQIAQRFDATLTRLHMRSEQDAPYLLRLLGIDEGTDSLTGLTPEAIQAHTLDVLTRMILAQSADRPLVLGIEDLHWIDKTSEAFLARLVEAIGGQRVLLLTTSRPGYSPPWLTKSYATQVALRVLSTEASRDIVRATAARSHVEASTAEAILRRAEGNPLFLEELTLSVGAQQDPTATQPLPDTIQGVLAGRIDRLPEDAKRTLQTAAVLGREFALRLLAEVVQDGNNLESHISALKQREFLYERSTAEGPVFTFKHVLTQEVAYDSLLSGRCQALHEAAGRALERLSPDRIEEHCEVLAYHFSRCADREKALDYLELANRKAIRANAVLDAKAYFEDALRTLDALPDTPAYRRRRIGLFIPQVHVFILANQLDQYERHLERGAAIAESLADDGLRGHFLACVGHTQFMLSRMPEALATLERAGALCERAGNSGGAGHAYAHLQWTHLERGEFEDALRYEPPALLALDRAPDLRLRVYSLSATSIAYAYLGCWDIAVERAQAALRDSEAVSDPSLVCFAQWVLCIAYTQKGAVEAAVEWGRRSYETAPTPGDRGWAQVCYGSACALCEPGLAIDLLEPVSEMYASAGALFHEAWAKVGLGNAYLAAGRFRDARRVLTRAVEAAQSCTCFMVGGPAERLLGEVALAEGSAEALTESQQRFERVIELFRRSKAQNELALAYSGCGRLHARLGQHGRAREYLSLALGIFEGLGTPGQPELVRVDLATLAG